LSKRRQWIRSWWPAFEKGALAGFITLLFGFLIRLGGFAPFLPESAITSFIAVVPASIQEPAVQALGGGAKILGLFVASIIALAVYGIFGNIFERFYVPRLARVRALSRFEKFLLYSLVPWAFTGLFLLALSDGPFGVSISSSQTAIPPIFFPLTLLLSQLVFGAVLSWQYSGSTIFRTYGAMQSQTVNVGSLASRRSGDQRYSRRTFIEKGALGAASLVLAALSLEAALSILGSEGLFASNSPIRSGTPYNGGGSAPSIFGDPRLQTLVDSEVTSNDSFYQVSIDAFPPQVASSSWSLVVKGLVGNPGKSYSLQDLQTKLPQTSQYTTFECVSNIVNGNLISNAKWSGVKISDLLSDVGGVSSEASYLVFYSVDGYSVGVPIAKAMMQDSLLAHTMNDSPLPAAHGFPLRAVIPGLYGMMSAKWINRIEVVGSVYSGYWQTRGWTNDATINTLAFISVPPGTESLSQYNGSVIVGGVAFAGDRGISKVEVSFDQGSTWQEATLKQPISNLTWTLWAYDWHPSSPGNYNVYARATDGTGALQTSAENSPFPNGASGYAVAPVTVTS
jgi:DMSO/TMAO reductase YedYZ molybdopterin-dependent catalytic subunit